MQLKMSSAKWRPFCPGEDELSWLHHWHPAKSCHVTNDIYIICITTLQWRSGSWFNIKLLSYQYRKSHCGDKTVVRSSYLHNGISYTGKMSSLYWIGTQVSVKWPPFFRRYFQMRFIEWNISNYEHNFTAICLQDSIWISINICSGFDLVRWEAIHNPIQCYCFFSDSMLLLSAEQATIHHQSNTHSTDAFMCL